MNESEVIEFVEWKDRNTHLHGNGSYYAKTGSKLFDVLKFFGVKKIETKYYKIEELLEIYKNKL